MSGLSDLHGLTQIGQWLLNVVAILLFLALSVAAINRVASRGFVGSNMIVIPCVALLLLLTVGFLLVHPPSWGLRFITSWRWSR